MDWKTALGKIAPTAAALLAGPFAGMAVAALGDALGMDQPTVEKIGAAFKAGQMTGEQLVAIKQAEQALVLKLEELGVKREEIDAGDRASARAMQVATGSWVPGTLAVAVTVGFFGILSWLLADNITPSEPLLVMLGSLGTAWASIIAYYFGSSHGSLQKSTLLAQK